MAAQPRCYRLFTGINVAAYSCTFATQAPAQPPSAAQRFAQSPSGFDELLQQLHAREPDNHAILVVLEATGTYWMRLALHLIDAGIAVAVVNPQHAHDVARTIRKRAKTDAIDAQMLAEFAARLQPQPWTPPPAVSGELQQRLTYRDALIAARTQFRNQRHALERQPQVVASVRTRLDDLITTLDEQIADVDAEIRGCWRKTRHGQLRRPPWQPSRG